MKKCLFVFRASACVAALAAGPILTGCSGVVKNLNAAQVNAPSLTLNNPFGTDRAAAAVLVTSTSIPMSLAAHAALQARTTAPNVNVYPFTRQSAGSISSLSAATASVSFAVNPSVTVDGTATLPATFTLSTVSIIAEADDLDSTNAVADSVVLPALTSSAPIVFTQSAAGSSTYTSAAKITLATGTISGATVSKLFTVVTGENLKKQAVLTLTATSPNLPAGSLVHIKLDSSSLNLKAN
jgi:hypothetical protein